MALFDADHLPGPLIRRAHQRSLDIYNDMVGTDAPTRQQLAIMIAIAQSEAATLNQLSAVTGVDRNTISEILNRLEKRELVVRARSASDARALDVSLTREGKRIVQETIPLAKRAQEKILEPLPAELRPVFVQCLRILLGLEEAKR
ncbi:MarR family winged helix-turn-helix transcriptional regulator [Noviherbaspirillum denitrificans]|uniref:HTH marR-type domain-containing protein n=1 Tax=Noviherbaspirillum denitrificans TaxID=1968433 RepID=A0A254TF28_9BURK|nr:MarR family transcriptional regulator [Noviherbaspirillum denitrificans]OWW21214.1 hypothetical protein AYR66_18775 [Noviherbaspirillum denitrificans]